jgi:hypothetical protein
MEHKITLGVEKYVPIRERIKAGANTKFVFESSEYALDELQVTITNGDYIKRHTVKGNTFDLTQYTLKAGVIELTVDLVLRGAVAKTWLLEPFVVRENGGEYYLIPEVALLRKEVRRLRRAMRELNSKIKETM